MLLVATEIAWRASLHGDTWVVSRCHDLGLLAKEVDQAVQVKVLRGSLLTLWPTTVEQTLVCKDLRTVHIERAAELDEAILCKRCNNLVVFQRLVYLLLHLLKLCLFLLLPFLKGALIPYSKKIELKIILAELTRLSHL